MFTKKFLSLSLAAGLIASASSNVFAFGGQSDVAHSPSVAECNISFKKALPTILTCRLFLKEFIKGMKANITLLSYATIQHVLQQLDNQLNQSRDEDNLPLNHFDILIMEFTAKLEFLYDHCPEFKQAADSFWGNENIADKHVKRNTGFYGGIESKNNTTDKHVKRHTNTWR